MPASYELKEQPSQESGTITREFPPFRLDTINECLWRCGDRGNDERILLTPKAFAILHYLVKHAGRLVTQDELLEALWPDTFVQPEVLKSHIRDIRFVLGDDFKKPRFIETLPRRGYQFVAAVSEGPAKRDQQAAEPAARIVGRDTELARLRSCFQRALRGERQLVFVTGEAGIGKTALVEEFLRHVSGQPGLRTARGQCVEGYGGTEPYYAMLEAIGQLCEAGEQESAVQILASWAPTWLVQFPALVKREQRENLHREIVGATRERMLREIADALETITAERPLLLLLSDLHWVDPSTVDLMSVLARRRQPARLMIIATYRPVDAALADHPLKALKQDLLVHHLCHEIALEPLNEADVAAYLAAESAGFALPEGLAGLVYRHSEGNPLFMVAALKHMCDRGLLALQDGGWRLTVPLEKIDVEAPDTLRQMIELRMERLSAEEQRVLEVASVLRKFPLSVTIAAAVSGLEPETCEELLDKLARRHQIIRPVGLRDYKAGSSPCYEFVHVLYREVWYRRIGTARRAKLHLSVAEQLEGLHATQEAETAFELSYQFQQGGDLPRALQYLLVEGES